MRLNLDYSPLPIVMQPAGCTRCRRYLRIFFSLLLWSCPVSLQAAERAVTLSGAAHRGALTGARPADLAFRLEGDAGTLPLQACRQIAFTKSADRQITPGPLRRVMLWSGERLTGDWQEATASAFLWRWLDLQLTIPPAAVAQISHPSSELNFQYDDFETLPAGWMAEPGPAVLDESRAGSGRHSLRIGPASQELLYRLAEPLSAGRMELDFYDTADVDSAQIDPTREILCEWAIGGESRPTRVSVLLAGAQGQHVVAVVDDGVGAAGNGTLTDRQRIPRRAGWHRLSLTVMPGRFQLAIDDQGLARGEVPDGGLRTITLVARRGAQVAADTEVGAPLPCVWVDDFKLYRRMTQAPVSRGFPPDQDVLVRPNGDELFGTLTELTPRTVTLRAVFGDVALPWTQAADLHLRQAAGTGEALQGWWVRIEFQGPSGEPAENADWIWGALQFATDEHLVVEHPTLGTLQLPRNRIRRMEPLFCGTRLNIEPSLRHLGDEIRESFRQPLPDGTDWESSVTLDQIPTVNAYLALDAAELEPAGPATPRDRPLLAQLRAGDLQTELWLNGKLVDDLNRHVSSAVPSSRPVRLRIAVPNDRLIIGTNQIRLSQKPGSGTPASFDDCEISNVALEFDVRPKAGD